MRDTFQPHRRRLIEDHPSVYVYRHPTPSGVLTTTLHNRPAFLCPDCKRRCYRLHLVDGSWHCRRCSDLDYASRHSVTQPHLARARWLRRRLGASEVIHSPINPSQPNRYASSRLRRNRQWRIALLELRQLEAAIARNLHNVLKAHRNAALKPRPQSRP